MLVNSTGADLTERYAVIVSFGVYFNGTTLDEIAALVGVQASPYEVLSNLVRCGDRTLHCLAHGAHFPVLAVSLNRRSAASACCGWSLA